MIAGLAARYRWAKFMTITLILLVIAVAIYVTIALFQADFPVFLRAILLFAGVVFLSLIIRWVSQP